MTSRGSPTVSRPTAVGRARCAEIVVAASTLIRQRGYHGVALKDVADAVGVTAPALYRHFPSKQALLVATISDGLAVAENAAFDARDAGFSAVIAGLARAATDHRNLWMLLHRESRHLVADAKDSLGERFANLIEIVRSGIITERAGIEVNQSAMLARAILAALSAPSQYRLTVSRSALAAELTTVANQIARVEISTDPVSSGFDAHLRPPFQPSLDRHEAILAAAASLFAEFGYHGVTVEDIGAAVSMAGPSIYHHFSSKSDILAGVLWRSVDWIESDMTRAIAGHATAERALQQLYADYADLALHHRELFDVFTIEGVHLPASERDRIGRAHGAFVDRWVSLLRSTRPEFTLNAARTRVCASLCVINDLGRSALFHVDRSDGARLASIATAAIAP